MNDLNNDDFVTDVVNEYSDTIYRVALNITKNSADAFDVCQEVFIRLIKNKHKIKDRSHLKAWLLRVAVNCAKSCKTSAYVRHCVPLAEARDDGEGKFISVDDFARRAGAGKSTIEMLESVGAFGDIPKTAQLSLF